MYGSYTKGIRRAADNHTESDTRCDEYRRRRLDYSGCAEGGEEERMSDVTRGEPPFTLLGIKVHLRLLFGGD